MIFNRERSVRSWEVSHTNEFLTQMERFRGILICTTNRISDLDTASIRRFNHKIAFGYLKPEGNIIFYQKLLLPLVNERLDDEAMSALRTIHSLAPGDFRIVKDRFCFYSNEKVNHRLLLEALLDEAKMKQKHMSVGKTIGF